MGLFKCCCKTCEGCGRGQLDDWAASEVGTATPKTRWRFQNYYGTTSLFKSREGYTEASCGDCEKPFSGMSSTGIGSTAFLGLTDWKFALRYSCRTDIDGDIYCNRINVFAAIRSLITPRLRLFRGKAYKDCNPAMEEECTHLIVARATGSFEVWFAYRLESPALCNAMPDPPTAADIPVVSPSVLTPGYSTGGWTFWARRVSTFGAIVSVRDTNWPVQTTPFSWVRARTALDLAESRLDISGATGNCGVILVPSKHDPGCCSIWDCNGSLDCSGVASMNVAISTNTGEFDACLGFFVAPGLGANPPPTDVTTATPSWNIDGGNWELFDVA